MNYLLKLTCLFIFSILIGCSSSSDTEEVMDKTFSTTLSTTSINFGNVEIDLSSEKSFTIQNTGTETISISNITVPTGFSVTPTNTTINSGSEKTFTVVFTPNQISNFNGNISITSNSNSSASIISLSGMGIASTSAKTYTNTIAPIMARSCSTTGCHTSNRPAAQLPLTTFEEVKNGFVVDDSWGEIASGRMPKAGVPSLTQEDKDHLQLWINTGYPTGELTAITYASKIAPIINQNCATSSCHDSSNPKGGLDLSNYLNTKNSFEATGSSSSIGRIESGNMPKNASMLSQANIDLLKTWIDTGFIEQ